MQIAFVQYQGSHGEWFGFKFVVLREHATHPVDIDPSFYPAKSQVPFKRSFVPRESDYPQIPIQVLLQLDKPINLAGDSNPYHPRSLYARENTQTLCLNRKRYIRFNRVLQNTLNGFHSRRIYVTQKFECQVDTFRSNPLYIKPIRFQDLLDITDSG